MTVSLAVSIPRAGALALALALVGCSSLDNLAAGDKIDYRGSAKKTSGLEVPPDLTQLAKESRYPSSGGTVSAATFQTETAAAAAPAAPAAAASSAGMAGDVHLDRLGNQRFVATAMTPEQLWPQLRSFWADRGFTLVVDEADAGIMETEWAENRAKLPNDFIRNTIGKVFDSLYSTGERDKFRTRVERTATGSEIYISHRGMVEVYTNTNKDSTVWQPRPADPELEAEFLQRLIVKLGVKEEQAKTEAAAVAQPAATTAAHARTIEGRPAATLQVDDGFDRAWRRVGLALDRSGFTVEDRDRAQGLFFVRYVDPSQVGKDEPGFFSRLFSFGKKEPALGPARYRVAVKGDSDSSSTVSVLSASGAPENGDAGKRIVSLLLEDLK